MGAVDISAVSKSFGGLEIIHDISVAVADGTFVVLVGPSGCGKSTLLRMIAGLEEIDRGTIAIDGQVINEVEPKNRDIAMVFQNYALYPHMTIEQNMGFSLRLAGTARSEIRAQVAAAARTLGLSDYLHRYPKQLSGGQRQRVAMGRAIVRKPRVFLFDEPLSNLDAKLRVQMRAELKTIHTRLQATTIYVTHDQVEAMTMADRIVVMRDGRIEQIGTPDEAYTRPKTMFVASFIGSPAMNFITGQVAGADGGVTVRLDDGTELNLPGRTAQTGQRVCLGIRPEHLSIAPSSAASPGAIVLAADVTVVEPMGHETILVSNSAHGALTSRSAGKSSLAPRDKIFFRVLPEDIHVFDQETELRLA